MCKTEEETRPLLANTPRVKLPHYDSGVKSQEAATASTEKERRRGWPTLAAAFFSLFLLNGAEYGFGCLVEPLMEDTGLGRSAVAVAGSTQVPNIFRRIQKYLDAKNIYIRSPPLPSSPRWRLRWSRGWAARG